ncbi:MAG: hypothetical protein A2836_01845 [Candidatus Taylorbacteria bacterium RIFCSPHIGHO2_01_FULL_45_63]|uniref:Uncharacterized protein n=1 Tax=Candidatus Taylorbacteria bacterium RIFCSPHIGHO2_02_FULL_45_35 TaxID=1802311 RepID=A0A1G2MTQ4_9BACT|nr:MAG: hypothetical protein A2836_01845 [Candidatus Taylorbacteria bacterium RIFCSPHIGHO2_01_FULL_45_63]OHA26361.1 MAG: hypothetical protein A3D56_03750 [Candidatus Taylorbacteria bacterium RIFCSPHIGHO2_02_FULL_45_35]OHA32805.1 MAG: hypothetical protein A3A22_02605 [Candidatus Taylorbacteria bacterium RIFCSPLOWO2_01_FULL_45_34b]
MTLKKTWIILRVVVVCVCLFPFISSVKGIRTAFPEIHKAQAEVGQAWKNLEHAAPLLAKEYDRATKKQQEVVAAYSSHDLLAFFVAFPMVFGFTSLLWQFVLAPIRTRRRSRPSHSLGVS